MITSPPACLRGQPYRHPWPGCAAARNGLPTAPTPPPHPTFNHHHPASPAADERSLKWPLAELRHWVRMAVGGSKRQAEELLAALAHVSCFGIE